MLTVFSGGILYEYSEEKNQYGLVAIAAGERRPLPDFVNFKRAMGVVVIREASYDKELIEANFILEYS